MAEEKENIHGLKSSLNEIYYDPIFSEKQK
ncbi:MAG: Uncharacterised protein [Polaribacter sp. SA4-10]|nr:MAG: Uncharacterised protein [Polaribacter sp. SA4-10]